MAAPRAVAPPRLRGLRKSPERRLQGVGPHPSGGGRDAQRASRDAAAGDPRRVPRLDSETPGPHTGPRERRRGAREPNGWHSGAADLPRGLSERITPFRRPWRGGTQGRASRPRLPPGSHSGTHLASMVRSSGTPRQHGAPTWCGAMTRRTPADTTCASGAEEPLFRSGRTRPTIRSACALDGPIPGQGHSVLDPTTKLRPRSSGSTRSHLGGAACSQASWSLVSFIGWVGGPA